jgi:hypothetical protein
MSTNRQKMYFKVQFRPLYKYEKKIWTLEQINWNLRIYKGLATYYKPELFIIFS